LFLKELRMKSSLHWYAIEVAYKKERIVASALTEKNYECYVPMYETRKVWSDRIKVTSAPLFGGYVFCRFDVEQRWLPILVTPGVRQVVSVDRIPSSIPDHEIDAIRTALESGLPIEPCQRLQEGDPVLVTRGIFAGVEGRFVRYRGRDVLILSVSLIQQSLAVEIDRAYVEPIRTAIPEQGGQSARWMRTA
jgi:transcription antitermination factor NusG